MSDSLVYRKKVVILLVEDNPGDIRLTREAIHEGNIVCDLHVAVDGEEALAFLRKEAKFANVPTPDLVLLDLNLPKINGWEVLSEMKTDQNIKKIPVVVLTTSKAEEDILAMYSLHANCFITKPVDFDQFFTIVQSIKDFWFNIVKLPEAM
ncbi:MAG: response regulator [Anaerolineaceae bacterium]|nr:response regulator [Anaerolineaceae bacterium]NTV35364.1 response regulator [Anaerolineaceae bacterium]